MNRKSVRLCAFQLHIHSAHITFGILLKAIVCSSNKSRVQCAYNIVPSLCEWLDEYTREEQQKSSLPPATAAHRTAYSHRTIPVKRKAHRHVDTIKSNTMTNNETTYSIIEWSYFLFLHSSTMNIHIFWLIWPKSSVYRKDLSLKSTAIAIEVSIMFLFWISIEWCFKSTDRI